MSSGSGSSSSSSVVSMCPAPGRDDVESGAGDGDVVVAAHYPRSYGGCVTQFADRRAAPAPVAHRADGGSERFLYRERRD